MAIAKLFALHANAIMSKDKDGIERLPCSDCDCKEYE